MAISSDSVMANFSANINKMGEETQASILKVGKETKNVVDQFLQEIAPPTSNLVGLKRLSDQDKVPDGLKKGMAYAIYTNLYFRLLIDITIIVNAIQIGLAVEMTEAKAVDVWKVCNYIFAIIFAAELVIAIAAIRLHYFFNPWNYLDFIVAIVTVVDAFILSPLDKENTGGFSVFRVFRLMRFLRIARILHIFPELMMVIMGLIASMKAMVWIFVLMSIFLYTAGIFCKELIGTAEAGYPGYSEYIDEDYPEDFNNYRYFGTVLRSMITLFNMIILAEWQEILRPVIEHQPAMVLFFICIVFLCSFGVLNVMIGIVVEHTTRAMEANAHRREAKEQAEHLKLAAELSDSMFLLDVDNDEKISREELEAAADVDAITEIVGTLGLPRHYSFSEMFLMLDVDGNGFLSKAEFVIGLLRLVSSDDFQRYCLLRTELGQVKETVAQMKQELKADLQETQQTIIRAVQDFQTTI